ncbi:MAG: glycosyltransferase family 2 protein [Flavobacteriales bacterium]|jgi:glycosyltransferase involved in cell wall biosynthesis|nr:glycosyltransferase family 2 protein [Flavobacteriales bacterium]
MKVSVVIPVYNKAPWLKACLTSVFTQTFQDFEVIAVDDASTDGSLALLQDCGDHRLRIIRNGTNVGPGGAAQRGMDAATGEYIMRVDADDIMYPDRFEVQVAVLDAHPEVGATSGHIRLMTEPETLHRVELSDAACKARMLFGVPLNQPATAYRTAVLRAHDVRFDDRWPHYGEDWMHQLELARHTRFLNLDRPLIHYRKGAMNIAHGRDRAADLRFLYDHVFANLGWPLNKEQRELHLATVKCFPRPFIAADVRAFHVWMTELERLNRERGTFDQAALRVQLRHHWAALYYHLPAFGIGPALQHMRCSGDWSWRKWRYLLSVLLER